MAAAAAMPASAHRRDEYLQAARIGIDTDRVDVQLDLTPGIAVAARVIAAADRDHDGVVSAAEARAYAAAVARDLRLDLDGRPLAMTLVGAGTLTAAAMAKGEGTLQLRWNAPLRTVAAGAHRLRFRNEHDGDIGVYLANVLVPDNDRVAVTAQDRDVDQREFTVSYTLRRAEAPDRRRPLLAVTGGLVAALLVRRAGRVGRRRALPRRRSRVTRAARPSRT